MKSFVVILFLTVFSTLTFSQSLEDITFGTDSTFEVVTWNLEWFPKNGMSTVDSVRKAIDAIDADIIACQEITDTTLLKQMVDSLDDYEVYFESAWFAGLAYIYKTDSILITDIYEIYTSAPYWNAFPRSPMVMELLYRGEPIILINNHYKCCGDGTLDPGNSSDEEYRRLTANQYLKDYIDENFASSRVIVIGDLNDILTDPLTDNVFTPFTDYPDHFSFADNAIATGTSTEWSFPGWPSHLDHILITNELFEEFENPLSSIMTIKVDDYLAGGLSEYDSNISDHRPVGLKLDINKTYLSINNLQENSTTISLFPNPCHSNTHVFFDGAWLDGSIQLYNALGQLEMNLYKPAQEKNVLLDLSGLTNGIHYLVFTELSGRSQTIKFTKI